MRLCILLRCREEMHDITKKRRPRPKNGCGLRFQEELLVETDSCTLRIMVFVLDFLPTKVQDITYVVLSNIKQNSFVARVSVIRQEDLNRLTYVDTT